jgi:hypothetical protein
MTNHYMFVAKAVSSDNVKIAVSRAEEGFLGFRQARMPKDYHVTDHFTVMDTSEKTVFLYISDHTVANPVGNLFVSDGLGYRFTHSLQNIIKGGGAVDFETIESMEGTFIANRYDVDHGVSAGEVKAAGHLREITEDDIANEEQAQSERSRERMSSTSGSKKQAQTAKEGRKRSNRGEMDYLESFNEKIKTYITHNKGSSWELIRPPEKDMRGRSVGCYTEDGCSLHLQMYSNNAQMYAPPYSQESAIGIIMSVGYVGDRLDYDRGAKRGTFLSRDGGLNWSEVAKIPLIYEFGDHGGLLVAAPNVQSTTQIRYSWNEGKTWTKLTVSDAPIFIDNIIIEPKSTAQQFVIYGSYDNSTEEGDSDYDVKHAVGDDIMITLDFSGLHEPVCKGVDSPGTEQSDFEVWSPHDDGRHGSNDKCFLGQQVSYIRRKQDAECFNGEELERQTMRIPCICTEADYECDMNYVKDKGGKCIKGTSAKGDDQIKQEQREDCALEGFYYVSQGYRKIPGDTCTGGVALDPVKKPCNSVAWLSQLFKSKSVFILLVIGAVLYYGWPIIEAIILVLPIPDPRGTINNVKSAAGSASDMVSGALTSNTGPNRNMSHQQYSQNLEAEPEAFLEDDDNSDDDIGKPMNQGLDYDSDEKNDEEAAPNSN